MPGSGGAATAALAAEVGQRRFAVQFAVGAQRQLSELHQHHRHHMRRQLFRQPRFRAAVSSGRPESRSQMRPPAVGHRRRSPPLVEDAGVTHRLPHVRQADITRSISPSSMRCPRIFSDRRCGQGTPPRRSPASAPRRRCDTSARRGQAGRR